MATRRMFSRAVIEKAAFLRMPLTSQALYFHLGVNADDDGVVEAFRVLRTTGANEDDLKVLASKNFIKVLNEDLVAYILDWNEHNLLRNDRITKSIYRDLLVQVLPETKLAEPRKRADASSGRPVVDHSHARIGKDSIGKYKRGVTHTVGEKAVDNSQKRSESYIQGIPPD